MPVSDRNKQRLAINALVINQSATETNDTCSTSMRQARTILAAVAASSLSGAWLIMSETSSGKCLHVAMSASAMTLLCTRGAKYSPRYSCTLGTSMLRSSSISSVASALQGSNHDVVRVPLSSTNNVEYKDKRCTSSRKADSCRDSRNRNGAANERFASSHTP
jgi:hypothetical protein